MEQILYGAPVAEQLDKISKTENGKEIVGILTHLIDTTQNSQFQDKYFSGIDLDLSKALFIFSYNDVNAIDRILLDRIHRIKFKHLSLNDKLTICNDYILPEFYKKFNINDLNLPESIKNNQNEPNETSSLEKNNDLEEIELFAPEEDPIKLKEPSEVYLDIYKQAREKARKAKNEAIKAYLEAKRIKELYMLDVADSSDSDESEEEEEELFSEN